MKMVLVYILAGLGTAVYCLYIYFTRTFNYWRDRNVTGPEPVPMFGNIKESALRRKNIIFITKKIYDDFSDEKVVGMYRMTTPNLLIRDPDILKHVLIKDFDSFADRGVQFSENGLGTNLFHADEKTWRVLRNKFTPLFTSGKLRNAFHLINERGDNFMKYVEDLTKMEPEQEVFELVQNYTMTTMAAWAFGLDLDMTEQSNTMHILRKINRKMFTFNYGNELDMMYPGLLSKIGLSLIPKEVTDFFNGLIDQIITERKGMPTDRKDFMDLILEMKQFNKVHGRQRFEGEETSSLEITEDVMAAQAFVFYAAGYENSAATMAYMLYHLALNPDVQNKVVAEIRKVLKRHGGAITYDALKDFIYLDRVFSETLRMHPQGDPFVRAATKDYSIPGTDVTLKKGQIVLVPVYGIHNDAKYWPNPSKFNPDRFSAENTANRHPAVYLPFGIGPRNCIGGRLAKLQNRVLMVKLLQRFRLEPTELTRRQFQFDPYRVVVFPVGGIRMNLIPRD